ncbi:hypothetical protein [Gordonia hirsuta]|uniref:hypothetical protein n=1 Tax=Gordonia hirsuta TaxID=53427 RepID=UPI0012DF9FC6|nr:hypothetical protein [Gordonia hirsuta]
MRRVWRKRRGPVRDAAAELECSRLLVDCADETAAVSAVLGGATLPAQGQFLLRHLIFLPPHSVGQVRARLGSDGYVDAPPLPEESSAPAGLVGLAVARSMRIDAQSVAQELAVVSSMTTRAGGRFGTWAVLATLAE